MLVAGALAGGVIPAASAASSEADQPVTAWGKDGGKAKMPAVKVGSTKQATNAKQAVPSAELAAWRAAQKERAAAPSGTATARKAADKVAAAEVVPEGQGAVPWHQISDFRITDALVARVNYSSGNLMLAGTDFDVAGVGQNLQLTRTYNSLDAPWGKVSQRWWQGWERYIQLADDQVVLYAATGDSLTFTKDDDGTWTTPKGYAKDLGHHDDGTWTVTDRKSGVKDTYNEHGTLTKVTDRNDGTITVTQHDDGDEHTGFKLTDERTERWVDLTKTDASQWQATDHAGRTVVYDLNEAGDLAKVTDTEGKATAFGYDSDRRLTKITTPEGRVTVFTYDVHDRVTSMLRATDFDGDDATGPVYRYAYSADPGKAGTTTVTDPLGDETVHTHDADGEISKVTDPLGHERSKTYDANRNVATATDAMGTGGGAGNVTTYGWDARNNPTSAKLPTGATSAMTGYQTIAGADLPGTMTMPDGEESKFSYDAKGNTTSVAVSGEGGGERTMDYNESDPTCGGFEGQACVVTDERGKETKFSYDAKGNLTKAAAPSPMGETSYTYDDEGRPATVTDGRGTKTTYTYDERDRVTKVEGPSKSVSYTYDGDGNLTQRSDSSGVVKYAFDPLSRETVRTLQDGSQTVLTYTADGNVESYQDPGGKTAYTYDDANRLTELTAPNGKKTAYGYNANDGRTKTTYPGGTEQAITLDKSNRPTKIKATNGSSTLVDLAYTYSYTAGGKTADGTKIRSVTDAVAGTKRAHSYDSVGRFSYAKETKGSATVNSWQYCYDKAGNLTSQGTAEGCPRGTTYGYNDAGQITEKNDDASGWSYDKAGNETAGAPTPETARTNSTWSDFSQLTSTTVGGTKYDAEYASTDNSERVKVGDTFFHHGPVGLAGTSTAGVDTGFVREAQGTLNSMTRDGKSHYYLTDALGSTVAMVDDTGKKTASYYYSPRGVTDPTEDAGTSQPHRFAGAYQDATAQYHMGARYYDSRTGRFTQPDPSGQETNPYLYAQGDPVNRIDPNGTISCPSWLDKACGAAKKAGTGLKSFGGKAAKTLKGGAQYGLVCYTIRSVTDENGDNFGEEIKELGRCFGVGATY